MRVPYPHVERPVMVPRPALVVSSGALGPGELLVWTLMITNALRDPWPGDITIPDWQSIGLQIPSKVRTAKISTSETRSAVLLGRLDSATWAAVGRALRETLAA